MPIKSSPEQSFITTIDESLTAGVVEVLGMQIVLKPGEQVRVRNENGDIVATATAGQIPRIDYLNRYLQRRGY